MKNNKLAFLAGILVFFMFPACDFDEVNTNSLEMTPEQGLGYDFALGGQFLALQQTVVPVGTQANETSIINQYQISYNLSADVWSGYFGQNNNWDNGYNHLTYYLNDKWVSASFQNSYTAVVTPWLRIKTMSADMEEPNYFALSQILKISAWHKATDMFGPIPYKDMGKASLVVPFDSQEDVYNYFFEDLQKAIDTLTVKAKSGALLIPDYDAVYAGDVTKWVKYANSLMLRLAMRIRYADPVTAKKFAEMAIKHSIGVITEISDEAKIGKGAGFSFENNLDELASSYNECRMGSSMYSYLVGYKDPRLSAYFTASVDGVGPVVFDGMQYQAVPTGHVKSRNEVFTACSKPNVDATTTPTYWMRASEVCFLKAEGALLGWDMGDDAASLYEQGIAMSFAENKVAADQVKKYISSGNKPTGYEINKDYYNYSASAPSEATAEFTGTQEQKLEKIAIQKWIALYPNGQEAWSEWRRTGYPKLHPVQSDRGGLGPLGVRRMMYPAIFYVSKDDNANTLEAVKMLNGEDVPSTKLWWDKKN